MNNSFLSLDLPTPETKDKIQETLREREAHLIKIIEAIDGIEESAEWSSLKTEIFDGLAKNLKDRIFTEAKKEQPDSNKLNRLSGQLEWAERYADLGKFRDEKRVELSNVRKTLYGKDE